MPSTLPPASGVLAVALELEVSRGRDPKSYVEALVDVLELGGSAKALEQGTGQQPHSAGARAGAALLAVLEGTAAERAEATTDDGDAASSPAACGGKLVRGLEAVDALSDFCGEAKRGQFGAVMALGVAARCGKAWCAVRAAAEQVPPLAGPTLRATDYLPYSTQHTICVIAYFSSPLVSSPLSFLSI
jgi:hypothetical protein